MAAKAMAVVEKSEVSVAQRRADRDAKTQKIVASAHREITAPQRFKGDFIGRPKNKHVIAFIDAVDELREQGIELDAVTLAERFPRLCANQWDRNSRKTKTLADGTKTPILPGNPLYHRKGDSLPDGQYGALRFFAKLASRAKSSPKVKTVFGNLLIEVAENSGVVVDLAGMDLTATDTDDLLDVESDELLIG